MQSSTGPKPGAATHSSCTAFSGNHHEAGRLRRIEPDHEVEFAGAELAIQVDACGDLRLRNQVREVAFHRDDQLRQPGEGNELGDAKTERAGERRRAAGHFAKTRFECQHFGRDRQARFTRAGQPQGVARPIKQGLVDDIFKLQNPLRDR
jgi:hypothetical protein